MNMAFHVRNLLLFVSGILLFVAFLSYTGMSQTDLGEYVAQDFIGNHELAAKTLQKVLFELRYVSFFLLASVAMNLCFFFIFYINGKKIESLEKRMKETE